MTFLTWKTGTRFFQMIKYFPFFSLPQMRSDLDNRARLDRDMDEISDLRK